MRGVGKWLTLEDAHDYRNMPRASRYMQLADVINDSATHLSLIFPDAEYEIRRRQESGEDVSNWPARSAPFVWQLDARLLKALDQQRQGVVIVTGPRKLYNPSLVPSRKVNTCDHWLNGVDPVKGCEHCDRRYARGEREPKHSGSMVLYLDDLADYGIAA